MRKPSFLTEIKMPLARDIMQKKIVSVPVTTPVAEFARILTTHRISGAPVTTADGTVAGIASLSDVAWHAGKLFDEQFQWVNTRFGGQATVNDIMTRGVYHVSEYDTLSSVLRMMAKEKIHRVLVTDGESIVGIISTMDIVAAVPDLLEKYQAALADVPNYVSI